VGESGIHRLFYPLSGKQSGMKTTPFSSFFGFFPCILFFVLVFARAEVYIRGENSTDSVFLNGEKTMMPARTCNRLPIPTCLDTAEAHAWISSENLGGRHAIRHADERASAILLYQIQPHPCEAFPCIQSSAFLSQFL
jgi:hypothetical protein